MASFIESALLKMSSENSTKAASESCTFEERLNNLVKQLEPKSTNEYPTDAASPPKTPGPKEKKVASLLLELTQATSQLAHVEMMIAQVTESVPEEEGAKKYHEISLQALHCSQKMLSDSQTKCLKDLGVLIGSPSGSPSKATDEAAKPIIESTPTSTTWENWGKADIEAVPEFVPQGSISSKMIGSGSLRQDLELLRQRQPERVIIVRRIKKLGFESPQLLDMHFSQYGEVKELLVAHSHIKPSAKRPNGRVRPAALGFVVMADEEGAQNAFKAGEEQMIGGHGIELGSFEAFDAHYADEEDQLAFQ